MVTEADPITDNWYQHLDKGQKFRVLTVDEDAGLIEIQHFDGDIEEIERAHWRQMELEPIEDPDNWAGPLDIDEFDDLGSSITDTEPNDWLEPFEEIKLSNMEEQPEQDWEEDLPMEEPWSEA